MTHAVNDASKHLTHLAIVGTGAAGHEIFVFNVVVRRRHHLPLGNVFDGIRKGVAELVDARNGTLFSAIRDVGHLGQTLVISLLSQLFHPRSSLFEHQVPRNPNRYNIGGIVESTQPVRG